MPTDPKTPEERLEEARSALHRASCGEACIFPHGCISPVHDRIPSALDRLVQVARLVERVAQVDRDMRTAGQGGGWNHVITADLRRERDRLLAELEKLP